MSDNVYVLRLNSGEELMAALKGFDKEFYYTENVTILIPQGQNNIALAPFMQYCKEEPLDLKVTDVMFVRKPVDGLLEQYNKIFQRIITPTKQIIT